MNEKAAVLFFTTYQKPHLANCHSRNCATYICLALSLNPFIVALKHHLDQTDKMTYLATPSGIMRLESTTDLFYRNGSWNPSGVADACAMPRFGPIHYSSVLRTA